MWRRKVKSTFHRTSCQSRETAETHPTVLRGVEHTGDISALKVTAEASLESHQWQWG